MLAQIPLPPIALGPALALAVACGTAALGAMLLLWGRLVGRFVFLLAGAGAGWFAGPLLAAKVGVSPLIAQVALAAAAALLGVLLAPFWWAVLAGALAGGTAVYFTVLRYLSKVPVVKFPSDSLGGYLSALGEYVGKCLEAVWSEHAMTLAVASGLAAGLPFLVGVLRLRLAAILMSSLVGGTAFMAALAWIMGLLAPASCDWLWNHWYVLGGAAAALAATGIALQYRRALRSDKTENEREGEPPNTKKDVEK